MALTAKDIFKALAALLDWMIDITIQLTIAEITDIKKRILKKKFQAMHKIAAWLDKGYRGLKLFVVILVAGAVIAGVVIIKYLITRKIELKSALDALRNIDILTKIKLYWEILRTVWDVAVQLDDRFKALEQSFIGLAQVFEESFGLPLTFLNSLWSSFRGYVRVLYTMGGVSDSEARLTWMESVQTILEKAKKNFDAYALNPGKWFEAIESFTLLITQREMTEQSRDTLTAIVKLTDKAEKFATGLHDLRDAVRSIQDSFPDEIKVVLDKQTGKIWKTIDDKIMPALEKIGDSITRVRENLEDAIQDLTQPLAVRLDKLAPWFTSLAKLLGYEYKDIGVQEDYLRRLFGITSIENAAACVVDNARFEAFREAFDKRPDNSIPPGNPSALTFIPIVEEPLPVDVSNRWYVGENKYSGSDKAAWFAGES